MENTMSASLEHGRCRRPSVTTTLIFRSPSSHPPLILHHLTLSTLSVPTPLTPPPQPSSTDADVSAQWSSGGYSVIAQLYSKAAVLLCRLHAVSAV